MSILIEGMEMPKSCEKCNYMAWSNFFQIYVCDAIHKSEPVLFDGKQTKSTAVVRSARADNCPLVEIPPHGRLIDADALEELFREVIGNIFKREEITHVLEHMVRASAMVVEMIKDAPTIIESEGEDG